MSDQTSDEASDEASEPTSLGDFTATTIDGKEQDLATYLGNVVLVVNTASQCGFTPQYAGLQRLQETYADRGFTVLGFPCDQFGHQEPGSEEEIAAFCETSYGVTFPMFGKVDVNGPDAHPLFRWLKDERRGLLGGAIKWNFTKFLLDRSGRVVERYAPQKDPAELTDDIERLLAD
jgi:glutathione peroxidase